MSILRQFYNWLWDHIADPSKGPALSFFERCQFESAVQHLDNYSKRALIKQMQTH